MALRVRKRARRAWLRLTGRRVRRLIPVSACDRAAFPSYSGLTTQAAIADAGCSTLTPIHLPEDLLQEMQGFPLRCESVLVDVRNARFFFANHFLHTGEGGAFWQAGFPEHIVLAFRRFAPRTSKRLEGTVAYLSNDWANNYYHWMQLTLPLLLAYKELAAGVHIDHYYVGEQVHAGFQQETLDVLGIPVSKVVRQPCRADRMLCAFRIHPAEHGVYYRDPWGHQFVRSLFIAPRQLRPSRKLFVRRGSSSIRQAENEADVVRSLRARGFEDVAMEGLTVAQQARLFSEAAVVVGVHGAALTNLLFAPPGARIVEIFPPGVRETSYFAAAAHGKLSYSYMIGEAATAGAKAVRIPLSKLERLLHLSGID